MKPLFCLYSAPLIEGTSASSAPLASNLCSERAWLEEPGLGLLEATPQPTTLWLQNSNQAPAFSKWQSGICAPSRHVTFMHVQVCRAIIKGPCFLITTVKVKEEREKRKPPLHADTEAHRQEAATYNQVVKKILKARFCIDTPKSRKLHFSYTDFHTPTQK